MITALSQKTTKKIAARGSILQPLLIIFWITWLFFFLTAKDPTDWWIENILVFLFFGWLFTMRKKIKFTDGAMVCILLFLTLHIYGARMAYTHNELGEYLKNRFHLWRNPYDRIVHFSFGFLLLYPFNELLSKKFSGQRNFGLLLSNMAILCLATIFELIEWGVAACTDKATGETYVATQGDLWDSQKDIFVAIVGALLFTLIFSILREKRATISDTK